MFFLGDTVTASFPPAAPYISVQLSPPGVGLPHVQCLPPPAYRQGVPAIPRKFQLKARIKASGALASHISELKV